MKILQVIPYFNPKFGGDVNSVYTISKLLSERGHEVTILTTDHNYDEVYAASLKNIIVLFIKSVFNLGLFIYSPQLNQWCKKNLKNYDVIHLHTFRSYQNAIIKKYAQKFKIPYIIMAHGGVLPFFEAKKLKYLYDVVWGYNILENSARVIALCDSEAEQYKTMGVPDFKIEVIPNGIDMSFFSNLPDKGTFRSKYCIAENEKIILFLGRIHKIKGIDLLIKAYADLLYEIPLAKLVIVGPDDNFLTILNDQILREKPGKSPLFTGPLYNSDKIEAYVDADVYVLPSRYETFPLTVLEAWACGTPVIVTKGCLIADIVEKAGYVTGLNADELKNTIKDVLHDEVFRKKSGDAGKKLVKSEFDNTRIIQKIEAVYQKTMRENK